jgi:hypothetical protein
MAARHAAVTRHLRLREFLVGLEGLALELQQPAWAVVPEATSAAYLDFPAVLVWDQRRP